MSSVVDSLKTSLEQRGEYVVLANITSGWFAVNPRTWRTRCDYASRDGRQGPNLVVYRTKSSDPRDHYVVPFSIVQGLLTQDTLKKQVNGAHRWNLTLKNGMLHVTHRPGAIDVNQYYGAQLIVENNVVSPNLRAPYTVIDERTTQAILEGIAREITVVAKSRSRTLRAAALQRANGICEACGTNFSSLLGGRGVRALQVHHKRQLALQDEPTVTNVDELAVVCANCHCVIHSDPQHALPVEVLRDLWRAGIAP